MKTQVYFLGILATILSSCSDPQITPELEVPLTYEFTRDGASSVSFQGQTDRLNMLSEMKSYVSLGDKGSAVDSEKLENMFANTNSPFSSEELNASTKNLGDKAFVGDANFFNSLFASVAQVSSDVDQNGTTASQGQAGLMERGTKYILVNEKGWEFTQFLEKGLMGSVFLNQIYNNYLTDAKIGVDVDNVTIEEGKNYTTMEHHWDEAFGYYGVSVDFPNELPSENDRFWAKYAYSREEMLGTASNLKLGFLTGRTAIVNKNEELKNNVRALLQIHFELVAASTAIHYINQSLVNLEAQDQGELFHTMSEAYQFVNALKYIPNVVPWSSQIETILSSNFGANGNFWLVTEEGLLEARSTIAAAVGLENEQEDL